MDKSHATRTLKGIIGIIICSSVCLEFTVDVTQPRIILKVRKLAKKLPGRYVVVNNSH